ncbi:tetraspanin-16-like [Clupea harengus]|uniref:Tetraspanin n=1 Tax=Clupea harengus TaxID=7950 RepID=A0A6P8F5R6_CLUHA|nr:tetraspanin-16-like [Clupea harengus]XP_042559540.1 tetraspanin-16-like [Clupea harengus]
MAQLQNLYAIMKYLMMMLSGIILISGIVLLAVGIWISVGASNHIKNIGDFSTQLGVISTICTVSGGGLTLLGLIGCYGAWAEKRMLILVYFVVISVVFLAELTMTLLALVYQNRVENVIREASKRTLKESYKGPGANDAISAGWNAIMMKFKCCGVSNTTNDFVGSAFTNATSLLYPTTCCVNMESPSCDGMNTAPGILYSEGCDVKMITIVKSQGLILGSVAACICVMELASMVISVVLYVRLGALGR